MQNKSSKANLSDVVRRFAKQLIKDHPPNPQQVKVLLNIIRCRTAQMGGHEDVCHNCGEKRYSYNSCGDRHCPVCLATKQALWIDDLEKTAFPVKHFHIVFTLPHALNNICLYDKSMFYSIFFSAVWRTLHSFGYTHYGAETGAIAVLHSWGQNLCLHPHIHCIVPAAGYSIRGKWKNIGHEKYLYPVKQLSATFKGKFMDSIRRQLNQRGMLNEFAHSIGQAYQTPWVVFSESSLADVKHVIGYLGQYTHRIAISNKRILSIDNDRVDFLTRDYRDQGMEKTVSLQGTEFLRRFLLHVFPKGFVRIRRYGIYNARFYRSGDQCYPGIPNKVTRQTESRIISETRTERMERLTGFNPGKCPKCGQLTMQSVREIPRIRSPATHLPSLLVASLL